MSDTRVTTIRLDADMADALELVAKLDGLSVSESIRRAIAAHVAKRKADPIFRQQLRRRIEDEQRLLERLTLTEPTP